jgi:phage shock protein B
VIASAIDPERGGNADMEEFMGLMIGLVAVLLIFGGPIFLIALAILKGGKSKKGRNMEADEARKAQEIYQGITRMEERIEALETIILEHEKKR